MANEFNIKNGFISKGDSSVEGSLSANTIYIQSITSGTSVANLSIDSNGKVISGSTGTSGVNGSSGTSGIDGSSGTSGSSGSSGSSGTSGSSGSSGSSGTSGIDGTSGSSGTSGNSGTSGTSGTSGINGSSGTSGIDGTSGSSGSSGTSGINGSSGTSGVNGTSGTSGSSGSSGTSGLSGTSGTSGLSGTSGTSGGSGSSGTSGIDGTSGTSGIDGTSGTSGSSGTSGVALILNNVNNNVITATGTSGVINGESNFTFDGTNAIITGNLNVSGGTQSIFSGNSSSDLVRITQTGSGNAFVVEDETNPDSSQFVIDANGSVGIGTNILSPNYKLDIASTGGDFVRLRTTSGSAWNRIYYQKPSQGWSAGIDNVNRFVIGNETDLTYRMIFETGLTGNLTMVRSGGNVGIGIDSPSAKLHINNTGTTNSFLVEDETNPDSTPFVINNDGFVGIGTTAYTSTVKLNVNGSVNLNNSYLLWSYDGSGTVNNDYIISNDSTHGGSGNISGFYLFKHDSSLSSVSGTGVSTLDAGSIWLNRTGDTNYIAGNVGIGIDSPSAKLHINNTTSSNTFLVEDSTNPDSSPFVIDASGNTGIGIETPTQKLQVVSSGTIGNTSLTGSTILVGTTNTGLGIDSNEIAVSGSSFNISNLGNNPITLRTNGSERIRITETGQVGIGTPIPTTGITLDVNGGIRTNVTNNIVLLTGGETSISGTPTGDGIRIRYEESLFGVNQDGLVFEKTDFNASTPDGGIMFANLGSGGTRVDAMSIRGTGNVGIGTTSPTAKLDVSGKTKTTNFQMTSGATAGYVLTSDASGNASWSPVSASTGRFGISDSNGIYIYYSSLTLAMSAATAGQTIEVFTDYTESGAVTITLKDGVTINGNGHTYILTTNSQQAFAIANSVTTTASILNLNVTCTGTSSSCLYLATNTSGTLTLTGSIFRNTSNGTCISNSANSDVEVLDFKGFSNSGTCVSWGSSGNGKLRNSYCNSTSSYGYIGNVRVDNCVCISGSLVGLYNQGNVVSESIGISSGGAGIQTISGVLNNCKGYSSAGPGIYVLYANAYSCFGYSTASYGIQFDNEPCRGYDCFGFSTANNGIRMYRFGTGSDLQIFSSTALSTSAIAFFYEGYATSMTCISEYNNSAGHAVQGTNNSIISSSSLSVINTSANCLYSPSAITQKYAQCAFKGATTPVNANITQGIINTQDNYGNILI